jgi:putative transcriptional regulator
MPADTEPDELSIKRLRLFAGYSGWGAGQLEAELEEPSWIVVDAEPDDAFADDPDRLWRTVLQRKGGSFSLMENMPFDPELN